MRQGWLCPRCKASVSPDERTCPGCSVGAAQPVMVPSNFTPAPQPWTSPQYVRFHPPTTTPIIVNT